MQTLEQNEVAQIGGGDVDGFGPGVPPSYPSYEDPNLQRFIEWKMLNPGYPYDQL